jgi:hypothetical protein
MSAGVDVALGTLPQARAMVGARDGPHFAEAPVDIGTVRHFAAMVHDPSPGYWDVDFATDHWGALLSPQGLLLTWTMALEWKPGGGPAATMLLARVPLPGSSLVSVETDVEFFRRIRVGDWLNVEEQVTTVSDGKRTRLGFGHFVASESTFRRQDGGAIARYTHVIFRYEPNRDDGPSAPIGGS